MHLQKAEQLQGRLGVACLRLPPWVQRCLYGMCKTRVCSLVQIKQGFEPSFLISVLSITRGSVNSMEESTGLVNSM